MAGEGRSGAGGGNEENVEERMEDRRDKTGTYGREGLEFIKHAVVETEQ